MTQTEYDDQWVCGYCGKTWVVPSLARRCEAKHDEEEQDDESTS